MSTTDVVERLKEALVAIANGSTRLQTITRRSARNLVPWNSLAEAMLPIVAYHVISSTEIGGGGDNRLVVVQFSAFAGVDNVEPLRDADATVNALIEVLETAFSQPLLDGQGLDACKLPGSGNRRWGMEDPEGARDQRRADIDLTFLVTK